MSLISNFTGLYTDDRIIARLRGERECEAGLARKKPFSFTVSSRDNNSEAAEARRQLREVMPELDTFFSRYNTMLSQLVHPAFSWGAETHQVHE